MQKNDIAIDIRYAYHGKRNFMKLNGRGVCIIYCICGIYREFENIMRSYQSVIKNSCIGFLHNRNDTLVSLRMHIRGMVCVYMPKYAIFAIAQHLSYYMISLGQLAFGKPSLVSE